MHHRIKLLDDNSDRSLEDVLLAFLVVVGGKGIKYKLSKSIVYKIIGIYSIDMERTGTAVSVEFEPTNPQDISFKFYVEYIQEKETEKKLNKYLQNLPRS